MKNKRLLSVFLIFILVLVAIPAVSAGPTDDALNKFVEVFVNRNALASALGVAEGKVWMPIIFMFFFVFSVAYGGLSMVPFLRQEKFGKKVITILAIIIGLMGIQAPFLYVIYGVFGTFFWILILFVLVALFFTVWGGFKAGWAKSAAELRKEQAGKARAEAEVSKARKEEYTALTEETRAAQNIRTEARYLKQLEGITNQSISLEESSLRQLMKIKTWLGQLAATGVRGTEEGNKAKERVVNIIRTLIPSSRREDEAIKKLKNLTGAIKALDIADYKNLAQVRTYTADAASLADAAKQTDAQNSVKAEVRRRSGLANTAIDDNKAAALAGRIMGAIRRKMEFENELAAFERKLQEQARQYTASLQRVMSSLSADDLTASSAALQEAINLKQQQDRELKEFTKDFTGIEKANNMMMRDDLADQEATADAIRSTTP
jgi:hypothetical protein